MICAASGQQKTETSLKTYLKDTENRDVSAILIPNYKTLQFLSHYQFPGTLAVRPRPTLSTAKRLKDFTWEKLTSPLEEVIKMT